jgi:hypothetical protein
LIVLFLDIANFSKDKEELILSLNSIINNQNISISSKDIFFKSGYQRDMTILTNPSSRSKEPLNFVYKEVVN